MRFSVSARAESTVVSDEHVEQFTILASAVVGRPVVVKSVHGADTFTDGRCIYVSDTLAHEDVPHSVAVQAALLAAGSIEKDVVAILSQQPRQVVDRYFSLELGRTAAVLYPLLPSRLMARLAAGGGDNRSASRDESFRRALGDDVIAPSPDWAGTLRLAVLRAARAEDLSGSSDDLRLLSHSAGDEPGPGNDDDERDGDESKIAKWLSAGPNNSPLSDALQRFLRSGKRTPDSRPGSGDLSIGRPRFEPIGRTARSGVVSRAVAAVFRPVPSAGIRYPEWNCHTNSYRTEWCTVAEYNPARIGAVDQTLGSGTDFQRPLARVGSVRRRTRRRSQGESLDLSTLVDYAVDRHRGTEPDPNIYEDTDMGLRDLSVLILLDCSGSTAEESDGRIVFDQERQLALDLTVALERLGDRCATYGFYSQGRGSVKFLHIKEFGMRFDDAANRRLRATEPTGFTRVGAAIRHSSKLLTSEALAKNMILLVIGDGLPYDIDGYEGRYARSDARQAIDEALQQGIGVVGVGIRSSTEPQVLADVWSAVSFRVVNDSAEVAPHLRGLLVGALNSVQSNGRRRELVTAEHSAMVRAAQAARSSAGNIYV
jgi:nitric oxide reductase NorD protein